MYQKINIECLQKIIIFSDIKTIQNIMNTSHNLKKIVNNITNIQILKFFDHDLLKLVGNNCIYKNIFKKTRSVNLYIENGLIQIHFEYSHRGKIYKDLFIQKKFENSIFDCISNSYLFTEKKYNLKKLDEITRFNFKNICREIPEVKIYYFTNGFDDQEYLKDTIFFK